MDTLTYYFYYLSSVYYGFPMVIRIAVLMIMALCVLYLFFGIRLYFSNYRQNKQRQNKRNINSVYKEGVEKILKCRENLSKQEIDNIIGQNRRLYKKGYVKEQITDLIITLKNSFIHNNEEINQKNYEELLLFFDLHEYWNSQVLRGNRSQKVNAMRKLHDLGGSHYIGIMSRYLYHRDNNLRKLARIEWIKFGGDTSYKFLEEGFDKSFTRLDEIRLHEAFKEKYKQNQLPLLARFIKEGKEEKYKQFLIKEIGYFCQYGGAKHLLSFLSKKEDRQTKKEIIRTLGILKFEPALKKIYGEYNLTTNSTRAIIVDAIINIGGDGSLEFLNYIYDNEINNEIKKKIEFYIKRKEEVSEFLSEKVVSNTDPVYYSHST